MDPDGDRTEPRLIVPCPDDGPLAVHATARVLWGTAGGGLVWWVLAAAGLPHALALGGLTAVLVAVAGFAGTAATALCTVLVLGGVDLPMRLAAPVVVLVAAAATVGPARLLGRRAGVLPVHVLCVVAVVGVALAGPAGAFLAPTGVAVARLAGRSGR